MIAFKDSLKLSQVFVHSFLGIALNAGLPSGAPPAKRAHHPQQLHPKHTLEHPAPAVLPLAPPLNGRASHPLPHAPPLSRSNARKQVMSWMDAPDDVYFRATEQIKLVNQIKNKHKSISKKIYVKQCISMKKSLIFV